jgi:hypothetical protein
MCEDTYGGGFVVLFLAGPTAAEKDLGAVLICSTDGTLLQKLYSLASSHERTPEVYSQGESRDLLFASMAIWKGEAKVGWDVDRIRVKCRGARSCRLRLMRNV